MSVAGMGGIISSDLVNSENNGAALLNTHDVVSEKEGDSGSTTGTGANDGGKTTSHSYDGGGARIQAEELEEGDSLILNVLIRCATDSETGTAQQIAGRIARECWRGIFQCFVRNMGDYPPFQHFVVFVGATTGSGAEPRAMIFLSKLLLRFDLPEDLFEDLDFCVFGLGDTAYEKFHWPAKKLSRRLANPGAREYVPEVKETTSIDQDGALDPWVERLLENLLQLSPLNDPLDKLGKPPSRVKTVTVPLETECSDPLDATTTSARHRCYASTRSGLGSSFLVLMEWTDNADEPFTITHMMQGQSLPEHMPELTTLRAHFSRYLDLNVVPRRSFFELLRYFATDELEREKLDNFVSSEDADDLYEYSQRAKPTIKAALAEFWIPRDYVLDLFPLRPRQFSIASSLKRHPRENRLCLAVVKFRTKLKLPWKGVCTSFLAVLRAGV
ncbi:riboflavin synthase domain-like protein [Paxillus ammoniavirescens]|nr:riboflavin synthase domain-like protein [Paxillus ammoniavirescens]